MSTSSGIPKLDDLLEALRDPGQTAVGVDIQNLPWPFCILYNGASYQSQIIFAPDPDTAATTANQIVGQLNQIAQVLRYPPLFSVTASSC